MNPDQTAGQEQSDQVSYCLHPRLSSLGLIRIFTEDLYTDCVMGVLCFKYEGKQLNNHNLA